MQKLQLTLEIPDDIDQERVIEHLNIVALCAMEEDSNLITGWVWKRDEGKKK